MNTQRLLLLGLVAALGVALWVYFDGDDEVTTASTKPAPAPRPTGAAGVGQRAADTPFDLRERDRLKDETLTPTTATTPPPADPPPVDPKRSLEPEGPPPIVVGPPGSPTIEAAMTAAKLAAREALGEVRQEMRKCWDTIDRGGVGDEGVEVTFSLGFDAEGHVITTAVQQGRENYIQGLETCLGPIAHGIEVPAPGEPVSVDVAFSLP